MNQMERNMKKNKDDIVIWLKRDTEDWKVFLERLLLSTYKSNRDVLCLKCWKIMSYEQRIRHVQIHQDHAPAIVTSSGFATESKFIDIARNNCKNLI